MLYLHNRPAPIIHRDLKSPNLLVDASWRVKASRPAARFQRSRFAQPLLFSRKLTVSAQQ
jgi:serine/threonine protein kinase